MKRSTWEVNLKLLFHLICHMQSYPSLNYLKFSPHEDRVIFLPLVNFTLLAFVLRAIWIWQLEHFNKESQLNTCPNYSLYIQQWNVNLHWKRFIRKVYLAITYFYCLFFFKKNTNKTFYLSPLKVWIFHRFLDSWLIPISLINFRAYLITNNFAKNAIFSMQFHEFFQFIHGLLQHIFFCNRVIMEQINRLANLFYVFSSAVWNQFIDQPFKDICLLLSGHDLPCDLVGLADLPMLGIRGLLNLTVAFSVKLTQNRRSK